MEKTTKNIFGAEKFLSDFSPKEINLNGHSDDKRALAKLFKSFLPHLKEGDYLELGCGSGILCRFIYFFSEQKVIPHGVDIEPKIIALAKKNNPSLAKNFRVADYFNLEADDFSGFPTINIFIGQDLPSNEWEKLVKLVGDIFKANKQAKILLTIYNYELINDQDPRVKKFISLLKKKSGCKIANHNLIVLANPKREQSGHEKR